MTVLLWGRSGEAVTDAVEQACARRGIDTIVADGDELSVPDLDGDLVIRTGTRRSLASITGLFVRPEATPTSEGSRLACDALSSWAEVTTVPVLNRPTAAASNRSKPYQLGIIAAAGFAVPDTLVTTDPDDVRDFLADHDAVIYKSVSGIRSIVAVLDPCDEDRLNDISTCPTQFQEFVPGTDHRVHVVGEQLFACRIRSEAIDYRYAGATGAGLAMDTVTLPDDVADRCLRTTRALGLSLAGIDLRQDPDGTWWCFEVNTSPGFIWFERHTGQPIADAIAGVLR